MALKKDFSIQIQDYLTRIENVIKNLDIKEINVFLNVLIEAYENKKHVFIMGNGGSSTTASHFVCDMNKCVSYGLDKRFRVFSLADSVSTTMSYANDVCYEDIFVEQLKNFLDRDDVVIGISGSGNSENVIRAVKYANDNGGITVGWTGYDGGKLKQISKYSVNANVNDMQLSEDTHLILTHICMQLLTKELQNI